MSAQLLLELQPELELELELMPELVRRRRCLFVHRVGSDQAACLAAEYLIVEYLPGGLRTALLVPGPRQSLLLP